MVFIYTGCKISTFSFSSHDRDVIDLYGYVLHSCDYFLGAIKQDSLYIVIILRIHKR